jgi:hypothetical protein
MHSRFAPTHALRASAVALFFAIAACGGASDPSSLKTFGAGLVDCDANPSAPACQPSCEEAGTCPAWTGVYNGGLDNANPATAPDYWASTPNVPCGIGGWGSVSFSSTVSDPQTGGGWSVVFPARGYADAQVPCTYYTEFQGQSFTMPAGTTFVTFSMDALAKSIPTVAGSAPAVYLGVTVRWMDGTCGPKVAADTQFFPPNYQWPGANPATNDFGTYTTTLAVPAATQCARVAIRAYYRSDRDVYVDNIRVTIN